MAAVTLTLDDLTPFADVESAKGHAMIEDALALAARVAPCIVDDDFAYDAAARAILRGVIIRWNESGSGAMESQSAGPYSVAYDTRQVRKSMFWPTEIEALQELCRDSSDVNGFAFTIDTTPSAVRGDGYWSQPDTWTPLP